MNYKHIFSSITPHLIAIIIFILLPSLYFIPAYEGKVLYQNDILQHKAMAKEAIDFRDKTGEEALWTNSLFGGMPAYLVSTIYPSNLTKKINHFMRLGLPFPVWIVFFYLLGFYILLLALNIDQKLCIVGAFAFALSSYFFIIIEAGHNTKAIALSFMPPVIAGVVLAYQGRLLLGAALAGLFLSIHIDANHLQITYYLVLTILIIAITYFVFAIREKQINSFLKASGILVIAALLGVGPNISRLWTTYEFSKYTIRGDQSELTKEQKDGTKGGASKQFATNWSYGKAETLTLLIPNFHGGNSSGPLGENSEVYTSMIEKGLPKNQTKQFIKNLPLYWGTQPFVSGPVYAGAIAAFFFVFGLFIIGGPLKWWVLASTVFAILLSWGKNFESFFNIFFYYLLFFNKFRVPSMILVIVELTIPLLGFVAINKIISGGINKVKFISSLKYSLIIVGGITLFFALFPDMFFDFESKNDNQLARIFPDKGIANMVIGALEMDRAALLKWDAFRSLIFILLAAALLLGFHKKKIKKTYLIYGLGFLVLADMWPVNKRYLSDQNFLSKRKYEKNYTQTRADLQILKDQDPHYRVYNSTVRDPLVDGLTCRSHKSIGGYHAAMLRRYKELFRYQLSRSNLNVFNMLNTKYFIARPKNAKEIVPQRNPNALGNAWFVKEIKMVNNADEEMEAMDNFNPGELVIVDKRFADYLSDYTLESDPSAEIKLTSYSPKHLIYQSKTSRNQLAVFSEVYYEKGWNAYVDGEPLDHIRVNYVLRALKIPAGDHQIEFKFEPTSYLIGEKISFASSLILLAGVSFIFVSQLIKQFKGSKEQE